MTEPYDEPLIGDGDFVIRRIDPKLHVVWDSDRGCERISSKAFQASSKLKSGMSVDIEKLMTSDGVVPAEYVTTPRFSGSVSFIAKAVRDLGLRVGFEPLAKEGTIPANPYHGEVWGPDERPFKFTNSEKNRIHRSAEWYVELDGVALR